MKQVWGNIFLFILFFQLFNNNPAYSQQNDIVTESFMFRYVNGKRKGTAIIFGANILKNLDKVTSLVSCTQSKTPHWEISLKEGSNHPMISTTNVEVSSLVNGRSISITLNFSTNGSVIIIKDNYATEFIKHVLSKQTKDHQYLSFIFGTFVYTFEMQRMRNYITKIATFCDKGIIPDELIPLNISPRI